MTIQSLNKIGGAPPDSADVRYSLNVFKLWRANRPFILALITLIALLIGWIGSTTGLLPPWAMTITAIVAYVAGGYTGLMGAIEEAREGKLDIDFLMIAAALGAALIGAWQEGVLLLFLFTLVLTTVADGVGNYLRKRYARF